MKINAKIRKSLNKNIHNMIKKNGSCYFDHLPIDKLNECMKKEGFYLMNEDGTKLCAVFCGKDGRAEINFGMEEFDIVENSTLQLYWHTMESGNIEITAYIS